MSTRVHELARELGLKSSELLDRIQQWGLDVKPSSLASLDPAVADQIRQKMRDAGSSDRPAGKAPAAVAVAAPPAPAPPATSAPAPTVPPETSAIRTTSAPVAPRPQSPAPPPPAAPTATATPPSRPAPAPAPPAPNAAPRPSGLTAPPTAAPSARPQGPGMGPLAGHGRHAAQAGPRGGAGPLSAHTPHRGTGAGGATAPLPRTSQSEPRPNPATPPPLRRDDYYISPTGTRMAMPGRPPTIGQPAAPSQPRRADGPAAGPMREAAPPAGPRRPVAPVATPPPPRRPDAPRPAGPEAKVTRPDQKFTPEQIRALQQSGQLGSVGRLGGPPRPGAPPMGPRAQAGPGLRRPPVAPPMAPVAGPPPTEDEDDRNKKGGPGGGKLFSTADRANRRNKRNERANERRTGAPASPTALLEGEEDGGRNRSRRGGSHRHRQIGRAAIAPRKTRADIELPITVRSLSEATGIPAKDYSKRLFNMGQMITINSSLDEELAMELALEFGVELNVVRARTAEDDLMDAIAGLDADAEADPEKRVPRPPIVTILGHVDHGKTSLLDRIRKSNVVASESGGITQHIGAYRVEHDGKSVTFVDTPGHEAFTAMRARGANVTDIVVLVVAADDGIMPQTVEAIAHAKAAEVPIVVALNKIDLPNINLNKIYGELAQQDLSPVEWGGTTELIKTSALTGEGIPDLLEMLAFIAEDLDLRADPERPATGTCLEAAISEGRGVVATVLVQDGTLRVGDALVCGDGFGRVRALFDDKGRSVPEAGPSTPVEVSGLDEVPTAGESFAVVADIGQARAIADERRLRTRGNTLVERQAITLENLYSKMAEQKVKSLNLILKADVQGSLEALIKELEKLENPEVPVRVLLKGVGAITESDILLADASQAIAIGFRAAPDDKAIALADEKKIDIRRYDIIYQVTDEIKKAVEGMLVPEVKEVHLGRAVVRQTFRISKVGNVAGCFVTQGTIERGAKARLIREGREIYKGTIDALKRFKDDVKEVAQNFECGIKISNFDDVKTDDVIEAYRIDVIRRTL